MRTSRLTSGLLATLIIIVASCRTAAPVARPAPPPAQPEVAAAPITDNLNGVLWIQTAAESRALMTQTFLLATRNLDAALADPTWTGATEQTGDFSKLPPAIIVDIDETILDNAPLEARLLARGRSYDDKIWKEWVAEASAKPIHGALEFATYAAAHGVTVFYVTNRADDEKPATRTTLVRAGFPFPPDVDTLLTRGDGDPRNPKEARRAKIAQSYRILLLLGDDLGDFTSPSGTVEERRARADQYAEMWGRKWIVIADPMYGSWEKAILAGIRKGDDASSHRRKMEMLNTGP